MCSLVAHAMTLALLPWQLAIAPSDPNQGPELVLVLHASQWSWLGHYHSTYHRIQLLSARKNQWYNHSST